MVTNWFIAFVVLTVLELVTINLVSVWFAVGAIASMVCAMFTDSFFIQLCVFIIVSSITLLITKPLVKKIKTKEVEPTNLDRVIGRMAVVTKEINKDKLGEVKVLGNTWTAVCDEKVSEGQKVKVMAIDGVKLIVKVEED